MTEFFIQANSFAAPFFSDTSNGYQEGVSAEDALERFTEQYTHPYGLFAADVYGNADDFHKAEKALATFRAPPKIKEL